MLPRKKEEIHSDMLDEIPNDYEKLDGSFIYDATKAPAVELEEVYKEIARIEAKQDIENLSGDELTNRVYERTGLERHQATSATTTVVVKGQVGVSINIGDKVASGSIYYSFVESKVINETGQVSVLVQCDVSGPSGNTSANTITNFPVTLQGLTSVTNHEAVRNGYDAETDDALLKRYYEYLQAPATSGNPAHYKIWAKEVLGVGDAKIYPTWNGGGTVKVVIIDANKRAASEELVKAVFDHIEEVRPIGAIVTVVSGTEKIIDILATVVLANGFTVGPVQTNFEQSSTQFFADIAFKEQESYVSFAKVGNLLLDTPGVGDYSNLLINNGIANVLLGDEEVPVLGTVTLGV